MSCHYSCSSCSGPTYLYLCTGCPSTRQLVGSACQCITDYIQQQNPECTSASQISSSTSALTSVADVFYGINIGFIWIYILITFCKIYHPKLRMILNFSQVTSLVLYYPFLHQQITSRSLRALSSLNFTFFTELICTNSGPPYECQFYENLIGPGFMVAGFFLCFFIAYGILRLCYRPPYIQEVIQFSLYWKRSRLAFIFHLLDISIVYWAVSLTRIVILSFWALLIIVPLLIFLVIVLRYMYLVMNSQKQVKLQHRVKYNWAFVYDQNYSFHYIDYLYEAEKEKRKQSKPILDIDDIADQPTIKPFFPHSNFVFFQILFKYLSGTFVVLLFELKPALMGYILAFLLLIQLWWFGVFCIYQRSDLMLYMLLLGVYVMAMSTFWLSYFWLVSFIIMCLYSCLLVCFFVLIIIAFQKATSKQVMKMFDENESQYGHQTTEKNSQEQLIKGSRDIENSQQNEKKQIWISKRSSQERQFQIEKSLKSIDLQNSRQNNSRNLAQ